MSFSIVGAGTQALDVIAVYTDDLDRSQVLRGENQGASLQHVSVARSLSSIATVHDNAQQSIHVPLPRGSHSGHHLILFAQEKNQGAILAAAMLPIQ